MGICPQKNNIMTKRRDLIKSAITLPLMAPLANGIVSKVKSSKGDYDRDYFHDLGVRTFINAAGTYTALTASLPHPEVIKAIEYAAKYFVRLEDIQDKVGERIAELLGAEGAMVTAGAASAITLGTAAVMTMGDPDKIDRIPNDLTGIKNEVIIQKTHRVGYDHAIRNCGAKIIEVDNKEDLENAINDKTAMMWFLNFNNNIGKIKDEEWVAIARKHSIPTFIDCAADVPPVENLFRHNKLGFDLVTFSGGKGLRGPQSAGILMGKKSLIQAARKNAPPNGNTVGRGMKVNKEEVLGMLVAIETYLARDHKKDWALWQSQIDLIGAAAVSAAGVTIEKWIPPIANHVPSIKIKPDPSVTKITADELRTALRTGNPSIETMGNNETVDITTWQMIPGEERIVANRIREILMNASMKK